MDKDQQGRESFKKYEVITLGEAPITTSTMTPEDWAEKDRLERWSRECNTCFMGIGELLRNQPPEGKALLVYNTALDWAMAHFRPTTITKKKETKPVTQASIEPSDGPTKVSPEPLESTPEGSEGNGIPKTTEELYLWVAKMEEWPDSAPARSFLVNKVKIEEAKIDSDPTGVYHETKALMGW